MFENSPDIHTKSVWYIYMYYFLIAVSFCFDEFQKCSSYIKKCYSGLGILLNIFLSWSLYAQLQIIDAIRNKTKSLLAGSITSQDPRWRNFSCLLPGTLWRTVILVKLFIYVHFEMCHLHIIMYNGYILT